MENAFTDKSPDLAEKARIAMHGRLLRCPLGGNPEDCPLHDIRERPVEERVAWLESKSDDETIALYQQHIRCLKCKLREDPRFG